MASETITVTDQRCGTFLQWNIDRATWRAATASPLPIKSEKPALQDQGYWFNPPAWDHRVIQPAVWPDTPFRSSPDQIIAQFRSQRYTQALALVVSWGGMWRRPEAIWGTRTLQTIDRILGECAESVKTTRSVAISWEKLTGMLPGGLRWSAVLTSKTLHFLCRSLGFEQNPPVALDNAVIRQRLWPVFYSSVPILERPRNWDGNSMQAYCRYMSAILAWAERKGWTTREVETTLFAEYGGTLHP